MLDIAFIGPRNITFDCYVFSPWKQKKGEKIEQFYNPLKELAESCDFENREEAIKQNIFITNMLDDNIQRKQLRETVRPEKLLWIAVNKEMGNENQQKMSSNNTYDVNVVQQFNRFHGRTHLSKNTKTKHSTVTPMAIASTKDRYTKSIWISSLGTLQ